MSDDLDFGDTNMVDDLMANCNQLRDRCRKAESELAKWKAIAIEATAQKIVVSASFGKAFGSRKQAAPTLEDARKQAAKELSIQISQEDGYLNRLEDEFLKMYPLYAGATAGQAQDALDKIREGR